MSVESIMRKLPRSTGAWTCRWFLLLAYLSVWLIGLGATVIPGTAGLVAMAVGAFSLGAALGSRVTGESCAV